MQNIEREGSCHRVQNNVCSPAAQAMWALVKPIDPSSEHCTMLETSSKQSATCKAGRMSLFKIIATAFFLCTIMESGLTLAAALSRGIPGFDISNYQKTVDFTSAYNAGAQFVIIKVSLLLRAFAYGFCVSWVLRLTHKYAYSS